MLALIAVPGQSEGDAFEDRHQAALAASPADVSVELRVGGGRTRFFQGEVIPLELAFSSSTPERYRFNGATYDRSGRMEIERFHLEPAAGAVDPLRDYFASGIFLGGGLRMEGLLGEEPEVIRLVLNEWLRFDRPGDYRLFVTSRRLKDLTAEEAAAPAGTGVTTGVVELTILSAQPGWADQALAQARVDLASEWEHFRETGCAVLRHLGTPETVGELIRQSVEGSRDCSFDAGLGLFAHPDRDAVVRAMEARLPAPGAGIDDSFLWRLARLSWFADHPLPADGGGRFARRHKDWYVETRRGIEERRLAYVARLAGSMGE